MATGQKKAPTQGRGVGQFKTILIPVLIVAVTVVVATAATIAAAETIVTTSWPVFSWLRFHNFNGPVFYCSTIQFSNRLFRRCFIRHFNKSKSTGLVCHFVHDNFC